MKHSTLYLAFCCAFASCSVANVALAKTTDIVIVRRDHSEAVTKRRGTITEWIGDSLTLSTDLREIQIDNEDIVEVQTVWPAEYTAGLASLKSGDATSSIKLFQSALSNESRAWAKRMIRADLVRACSVSDQHDAAIQHFLAIIAEDAQTRFMNLCPLQWFATNRVPVEAARKLISSNDSVEQLIGASWLIAGSDRAAATKVLDQLSRDIDARIKNLAMAQLWRLRSLNMTAINPRQIEVWEKQVADMPESLRAGPLFVVAEAQARLKQTNAAAINWMKIRIIYSDQLDLSAAALYQTGVLLHNTGDPEGAESLRSELKSKFPQSIWSQTR